MAPAMVLAQPADQAPCPSSTLVDLSGVDLAGLVSLTELSALADLPSALVPAPKPVAVPAPQMQQNNWVEHDVAASYDVEKRKIFDRTYKVSKADLLNIENKFGKVHVNTWNRNEIKVNVVMIARAGSEGKAQEILDKINVVENRDGNTIFLKTKMEPMHVSGNSNKGFEINYMVSMPEDNAITVKNSFGDVYLAALKGKADIAVKYGALKTDKLHNAGNNVKISYGSGNCGYINGGNVEVAYSSMRVEGTNGLKGYAKYSDFKIGTLGEELSMDVKYGSFMIDHVSSKVRKIALESGFSPISLHFEDDITCNFDVNVQFANFKVDKSWVNITSLEKDYTSAAYKGNFGSSSPKGLISINSRYGDVRFTK